MERVKHCGSSGAEEAADEARMRDSSVGHQLGRLWNEPVHAGWPMVG